MEAAHLLIADSIDTAALPLSLQTPSVDVRHFITERFGIDEARQLKEASARRPLQESTFSFVVVAQDLTLEAQNALLKLLEETPLGTAFYLIIPRESILIPTLRSRFITAKASKVATESAGEFLGLSYRERLEWIGNVAKKDPVRLSQLFTELGRVPAEQWPISSRPALLLVSQYVYNRGASRKMLIEELALSLPEKYTLN